MENDNKTIFEKEYTDIIARAELTAIDFQRPYFDIWLRGDPDCRFCREYEEAKMERRIETLFGYKLNYCPECGRQLKELMPHDKPDQL